MVDISDYLDTLLHDEVEFAKDELKALLKEAKDDGRVFIRRMGELTEECIKLRALNKITNDEFEELVQDAVDLKNMHLYKMSVAAQARAQRISEELADLLLNSLLKLI